MEEPQKKEREKKIMSEEKSKTPDLAFVRTFVDRTDRVLAPHSHTTPSTDLILTPPPFQKPLDHKVCGGN